MNNHKSESHRESHHYSVYGHDPKLPSGKTLLGFNGEHLQIATASYHLGSGYRTYSPALMRFCSPDSWSPFGLGGMNPYIYCGADPVNRNDPSGHMLKTIKGRRYKVTENYAVQIIGAPVSPGPVISQPVTSSRRSLGQNVGKLVSQFETRTVTNGSPTANVSRIMQPSRQVKPVAIVAPVQRQNQPTQLPPHPNRRGFTTPNPTADAAGYHPEELTRSPSVTRSRSSSPASTNSWDEWRRNPESVERELNEGIAAAIRRN
ncbi:RHS repeat-associated core domain-containing protein [Pseudomonas sp. NBRC 111127]